MAAINTLYQSTDIRVAGEKHSHHLRPERDCSLQQVEARHSRHPLISNQEGDIMLFKKGQGIASGFSRNNLVIFTKQSFKRPQIGRLIVDYHYLIGHYFFLHSKCFSGSDARSPSIGIEMMNVVPLPGTVLTAKFPPWRCTILCEMDKPRPVPSPTAFVVKKGSKILFRFLGAMPEPVSLMIATTFCPSRRV